MGNVTGDHCDADDRQCGKMGCVKMWINNASYIKCATDKPTI